MQVDYVHGYAHRETARLSDQAEVLEPFLHDGTIFPRGSHVLEIGSGTGAQTRAILRRNPGICLTCLDRSAQSLEEAARSIRDDGLGQPTFRHGDATALPWPDAVFDHAFMCFVLEHLATPERALREARRVLKPGGSLTIVEGDHGSALFHPETAAARAVVEAQIAVQHAAGGDALIGRRLRPLLAAAGFGPIAITPQPIYADGSRPDLQEKFTRLTFIAMAENLRAAVLSTQLAEPAAFDEGIEDLRRTARSDGTFCYTFFKAKAVRP